MTVEPIRDKSKIKQMYNYLNGKDSKYGLIFKFGLNTGLRISDIIPLKVKDIFNENMEFMDYLTLKEKKTGKGRKIKVNNTLQRAIEASVKYRMLTYESYLFGSKKGGHLGRIQAYRVLKEAKKSNLRWEFSGILCNTPVILKTRLSLVASVFPTGFSSPIYFLAKC